MSLGSVFFCKLLRRKFIHEFLKCDILILIKNINYNLSNLKMTLKNVIIQWFLPPNILLRFKIVIKKMGSCGWFSGLSVCLWLRYRSQGHGIEPSSLISGESASPSPSAPPPCSCFLSLIFKKQNKNDDQVHWVIQIVSMWNYLKCSVLLVNYFSNFEIYSSIYHENQKTNKRKQKNLYSDLDHGIYKFVSARSLVFRHKTSYSTCVQLSMKYKPT